jgi:CBS domain-containing protein
MGFGLPVEGDDGPFVGERVTEVVTLDAHDTVADARSRLAEADAAVAVVVAEGLAVGAVEREGLARAGGDERLLEVMDVVPPTVRPSATVRELAEAGADRVLVTDPDGRVLGEAAIEVGGRPEPDGESFDAELHAVLEGLAERFGDREPEPEELRGFLRERLVSEGRSPEEADRFLDEMDGPAEA